MSRIRTVLLGAVLVAGMSSHLSAQSTTGRANRSSQASANWGRNPALRGITLTDAQKTQVKAIVDRFAAERAPWRDSVRALHQSRQRPDSAMQARMMASHAAEQAAIRDVLTAEQRVAFDRNVANMKERRARRMDGDRGHRGGKAKHDDHGKKGHDDKKGHDHKEAPTSRPDSR